MRHNDSIPAEQCHWSHTRQPTDHQQLLNDLTEQANAAAWPQSERLLAAALRLALTPDPQRCPGATYTTITEDAIVTSTIKQDPDQ